jgi:hypothetical protein
MKYYTCLSISANIGFTSDDIYSMIERKIRSKGYDIEWLVRYLCLCYTALKKIEIRNDGPQISSDLKGTVHGSINL